MVMLPRRQQPSPLRMDSSSSSSSSGISRNKSHSNRDKYLFKVITSAIRGQSCPICFKSLDHHHRRAAVITTCLHAYCSECIRRWSDLKRRCPLCNAAFHSLFCKISFSSRNFLTVKLPPERVQVEAESTRLRAEVDSEGRGRRSRALPWRRTFGRPGFVDCDVIADRKLAWRASVYRQGLRAVPLFDRNIAKQDIARNGGLQERIVKRIEPWIRRELQAVLEDPDPSVIVHVASSLFIASLERNFDGQLGRLDDDNFLAPLRPFLHNWTNMFWHELRCFAESSLTMEAYDGVVAYV